MRPAQSRCDVYVNDICDPLKIDDVATALTDWAGIDGIPRNVIKWAGQFALTGDSQPCLDSVF